MANAVRKVLSTHGADPRDLAMIAYGGNGPVHALDVCRRKCLSALPGIADVRLTDYKVRVLDSKKRLRTKRAKR